MTIDKDLQNKFGRRALLKGVGSAALLPFLPVLDADAQVAGIPKRVLFMVNRNGLSKDIIPKLNPPSPGGYDLGRVLGRLNQKYRNKLTYLHGVHMGAYYHARTNGSGITNDHPPTVPCVLTGAASRHSENNPGSNPASSSKWESTGQSIDYRIADLLKQSGVNSRIPTVHAGVDVGNFASDFVYKSAGIGNRVPAQNNANVLFNSIFNGVSTGGGVDPDVARETQQEIAMLDKVDAQLDSLLSKVSVHDREKIQAHIEGLQTIKTKLSNTSGGGDACSLPGIQGTNGAEDNVRRIQSENMKDIIAHAFACDQTRVATLQWGAGSAKFPSLNDKLKQFENSLSGSYLNFNDVVTGGHHNLTHGAPFSDRLAVELRALIAEWFADRLMYLMDKLASIPEGGGTLLDNTLIVWTSEHSDFGQHGRKNIPMVLAGGLGDSLKMGQYLDFNSKRVNKLANINGFGNGHSMNDVYLSVMHGMGFTGQTSFGSGAACSGVIPELFS